MPVIIEPSLARLLLRFRHRIAPVLLLYTKNSRNLSAFGNGFAFILMTKPKSTCVYDVVLERGVVLRDYPFQVITRDVGPGAVSVLTETANFLQYGLVLQFQELGQGVDL